MTPIEISATVAVLALAVSIGLVTHELAHAAVLRAAGVPHDIHWFPGRKGSVFRAGLRGKWAAVEPHPVGETPPWTVRISAIMPLVMVVPLVLVPAGVVVDPFATESVARFAVLGWMACALPSPKDFSVLWYADEALPSADEPVDAESTR